MEKSNVRLDTNSGNGKPEQQRKLDSTMEMGQSLEGSENKGSSYIETEGVIILDTFRGDIFQLIDSIKSLVELDIENALVPHGIGGLARSLLSSSAIRLEQLRQHVQELEGIRKAGYDIQDELREQLAAKDAVIEKLREALIAGWSLQCDFDDARQLADEALALSTDSTQILAEVRRAERERVAQMILNGRFLHDESPAAQFAKEVAEAIRAME